ncbi:MAG: MgtC/SapB family protein [Candidatus Pacebacteria bacterium]|nr:MgtC/SapB family protein [Candidatus Paceibacterota bacterium]
MLLFFEYLLQILLSAFLGGLIGYERESSGKQAGARTMAILAVGSTAFTIISRLGFQDVSNASFDPSRIAATIVMGIGFLGAGLIFQKENRVEGLTTAAALWASASIGMAVGCKMYELATIVTIVLLFILWFLRKAKKEL